MGMVWMGFRRDDATAREILADEERIAELLESDPDDTSVDIDKAWHGIDWLLTGGDEAADTALASAVFGGEEIGADLGYGPARLLAAADVRAVADALRELDGDTLRRRFDPDAMNAAELYPEGLWDEDDAVDYVLSHFDALRAFYLTAADADESVVQLLC